MFWKGVSWASCSAIWAVDWRSKCWRRRGGDGGMRREKVLLKESNWSLDLSMGWEVWSLWREFSRREKSGWFLVRRASTVIPVPPGTALHQLFSVPRTGRSLAGASSQSDIRERVFFLGGGDFSVI
uniref:Uncharacterized protein n=1 Tax=Opuntia streptacantha TaxID=393608 RepID=A0A7C8YXI9_OPUST